MVVLGVEDLIFLWWRGLRAHLDRRRGFGVGRGRSVFGRGGSSLHLIYFNGAQLPFRVAGGAEGVEEAGGEVAHFI